MLYMTIFNSILVGAVIMLHFAVLTFLSQGLHKLNLKPQYQILVSVFSILWAHIIEIWLFAFGYYLMINMEGLGLGTLAGYTDQSLLDCSYFSFTTYTTVGLGDIYPIGELRFLAALESLTGFLLITWSASYIFIEMQRHWPRKI